MSTSANAPQRTALRVCRLGCVEYVEAARLQRSLRAAREAGAIEDTLLVLEHEPVITCGTRTEPSEVAYARTTDVPVVPVERGGKATYHGPGQVVVYPIIGVAIVRDDVRELVCRLEQAIIDTLAIHGLEAGRRDGLPGVWVANGRKVASVGLRLTRGVTFHGIALNVSNDLTPFTWFTPCGIPDAEMTSMERELDHAVDPRVVEAELVDAIVAAFDFEAEPIGRQDLERVAAGYPVADPQLWLPGERPERQAVTA